MNSPPKGSESEKLNVHNSSVDSISATGDSDPKTSFGRNPSLGDLPKLDISDTKTQSTVTRSKKSSLTTLVKLRPQDLTFEKFYRSDVTQIFLTVIGHETKFLSHVVKRTFNHFHHPTRL